MSHFPAMVLTATFIGMKMARLCPESPASPLGREEGCGYARSRSAVTGWVVGAGMEVKP